MQGCCGTGTCILHGQNLARALRSGRALRGKELQEHAGPSSQRTRLAPDAAAVQLDDLLAQIEADAGAARPLLCAAPVVLDAKELLEDARAEIGRDAGPGVRDRHAQ